MATSLSYIGGRVDLVDSAREKNKARAVVEIYRNLLKQGRYHGLHPFNTSCPCGYPWWSDARRLLC